MRMTFLLTAAMIATVRPGAAQGAPFTCWMRGSADELARRASPLDSAAVEIGEATLKVCYGRPSARGRKIMGGLVPFGERWRLGANEATTIYVPFSAELAGVRVEAGTP